MTSPYLDHPVRSFAQAKADRDARELSRRRLQAAVIANNVALTTQPRRPRGLSPLWAGALIFAASFVLWTIFATLVLWAIVSSALYLIST
jgi:hypothetical protein